MLKMIMYTKLSIPMIAILATLLLAFFVPGHNLVITMVFASSIAVILTIILQFGPSKIIVIIGLIAGIVTLVVLYGSVELIEDVRHSISHLN